MKIFTSIKESLTTVTKMIVDEILVKVNKMFAAKKPPIEQIAKELLKKYILAQPEMQETISGNLRYELGIVDPMERILNIIENLVIDIKADISPIKIVGNSVKGGITIHLIDVDYSSVLTIPDAIVTTEKGESLYWLRWLLLEGSQTIIGDYEVEFGAHGRTGGARMVRGGSWGVPSEFSGTREDNFITRAIEQMQPELIEKINQCLA